jgi:hypothetical protein
VEDQVLLIACHAVGVQGSGVELGGCSRFVDSWGVVLAEAGDEEGVTLCDVDRAMVTKVRAEFPVLADRRFPMPARQYLVRSEPIDEALHDPPRTSVEPVRHKHRRTSVGLPGEAHRGRVHRAGPGRRGHIWNCRMDQP